MGQWFLWGGVMVAMIVVFLARAGVFPFKRPARRTMSSEPRPRGEMEAQVELAFYKRAQCLGLTIEQARNRYLEEKIAERMRVFGLSREEVLEFEYHHKPVLLINAEDEARKIQVDPRELLLSYDRDTERSQYLSPNCLWPDQLEGFARGEGLPPEARHHIEDCLTCYSALSGVDVYARQMV